MVDRMRLDVDLATFISFSTMRSRAPVRATTPAKDRAQKAISNVPIIELMPPRSRRRETSAGGAAGVQSDRPEHAEVEATEGGLHRVGLAKV